MKLVFDHHEDIAHAIRTFWFKPERKPQQIPGQYIELVLPHKPHDKRGQKRFFTLSSSPTEELVSITSKHAAEHGSTFKDALWALKPGTSLLAAEPMGDFVLPKDPSIPLVFIAGGIGITPVRSIVKYLSDTGEKRHITLLYAVTHKNELAFHELFESYAMKFIPIVSEPDTSWRGESGRLSGERALELMGSDPTGKRLIYLTGPEPMIEALTKDIESHGIPKRRVVTDFFPGYTAF